jgi:hypothetical protein
MLTKKLIITLDHDGHIVPYDAFATVMQESVDLLRGVDCVKAGTSRPNMRWGISAVSMHSPIQLTLEASALGDREVDAVDPFLEDMNRLERGDRPLYFNPEMQARAKRLVSVLNHGISAIRFNSDSLEVRPTQRVAARVDELTERYFEIGSIEGRLDVLSVHGRDSITVWDVRWRCPVRCMVSDAQLREAKDLLRQRVSVRGRIKCEHKRPKEIVDVFDIQPLGDASTLPQAEDIAPVDLTGGQEPADYLRGAGDDE